MKKQFIKIVVVGLLSLGLSTSLVAVDNGNMAKKGMMKNFRAVPASKATIVQKGKNKLYCTVCGMTLPMFYKTNHAATHNGKDHQYCSIVCEIEDEIKNGKSLENYRVVDAKTLKMVDANYAYFVVGSKKPGTMSNISKYAFESKTDAKRFLAKNGGKIMKFDELYNMVKNSLEKDIKATKKRQAKAIKKGKMIYNKMCNETTKKFETVADAKSFLVESGICGKIKGKKHQAVALYLKNRK
jgi:nitrous oxide reductase accessory protein NosL